MHGQKNIKLGKIIVLTLLILQKDGKTGINTGVLSIVLPFRYIVTVQNYSHKVVDPRYPI